MYKNGAIVIHIDANCPDLEEFVDADRATLPWVKRCIDVTEEWWDDLTSPVKTKILKAIQAGDIWLNKVKYNQRGERIFGNVCLEIYLPFTRHLFAGAYQRRAPATWKTSCQRSRRVCRSCALCMEDWSWGGWSIPAPGTRSPGWSWRTRTGQFPW